MLFTPLKYTMFSQSALKLQCEAKKNVYWMLVKIMVSIFFESHSVPSTNEELVDQKYNEAQ